MNRIASRTTIALVLVLILLAGMVLFAGEYLLNADDWTVFEGNPHVYNGSNIGCGIVTDRDGVLILDATDGREYAQDYATRLATLHWVGDRDGYISAPAVSYYSEDMTGYNLLTGLYSYGGTGGEAKMTVSAQVQKTALDALGDRKGTVAVYNYKTGEILCAVSTPTYDPDDVPDIEGDTSGEYEGVYLNRFTQVSYVPGSIFKIITTAAALEMDEDCLELEFRCEGSYRVEGDDVTCEGVHGTIDLETALAKSCNCYFAQLTLYIGGETLQEYVDKLQVTDSVSFDGITTAKGTFDIEDAANVEIAWSGIGQYTDLVNPCRFMTVMGVIAGGGEGALPYLISQVSSGEDVTYRALTRSTGRLLSADTAETLTEMMRNNVLSTYGEWNFPDMTVCAKSGTAQLGGDLKPNATFAGFVTDEEYPLAFIAVVENAGSGSSVCVPIISEVLESCKEVMDK